MLFARFSIHLALFVSRWLCLLPAAAVHIHTHQHSVVASPFRSSINKCNWLLQQASKQEVTFDKSH